LRATGTSFIIANMSSENQYGYSSPKPTWANAYLWPVVARVANSVSDKRAFDLGCGNGATCNMLFDMGFQVTGIDPSESGIAIAKQAYPNIKTWVGSAYDDLARQYGSFPLVVSLEVIEHCFDPRRFTKTFCDLIEPGGVGIISTPYHGYFKNVVLAVSGKLDSHFTALWDGGHIKFFSIRTLRQLLNECGETDVDFYRVGRIPAVAKSMVAIVRKPSIATRP
jgi:2-polyprenyl-3-methyl-5-hydroxy-6-metoxy-1,4-benzoquinol methylase